MKIGFAERISNSIEMGLLPSEKRGREVGSELTFSVTRDYPDSVMETKEAMHRIIGKKGNETLYSIFAINLTAGDIATAKKIKSRLVEQMLEGGEMPAVEKISYCYNACLNIANDFSPNEDRRTIAYLISHDVVGHGPLSILFEDSANIEEIEINSSTSPIIIYHSKYGRCRTNLRFNSERDFKYVINRLISATQKELNSDLPVIDAQLPDGSRLHAQIGPYSVSGAAATIRLNSGKQIDIKKLIDSKAASPKTLAYLWMAIESNMNILISGAPASGKTSLLLALHPFIPQHQRVLTVEEDINELKLDHPHVVSLQGSTKRGEVSLGDQIINALHMRPERLMIGELRGEETKGVFAASNFGVPFMTTMHSNSNGLAIINRLKGKPMSVEPFALNTLDLTIFMRQTADGIRRVESVMEYRWLSRAEFEMDETVFESEDYRTSEIVLNGEMNEDALKESKVIDEFAGRNLMSKAAALKEHKKRTDFLTRLQTAKDIESYMWIK